MVIRGGRRSKRNCRSGLRELGGDFKDSLTGSVKTVKAVNLNSAHYWSIGPNAPNSNNLKKKKHKKGNE